LSFASDVVILSEFPDGDVNLMEGFYRYRSPHAAEAVASDFGDASCADMIRRCRYLRHQAPADALQTLGAMYLSLNDVFDRYAPDVVMSVCVDYYAVDLFERIARERAVPFIGLTALPLPGYTMITARGEHNFIREPRESEVDEAVGTVDKPSFRPFLGRDPSYNTWAYLKRYGYWTSRAAAFRVLQAARRDPHSFYYELSRHEAMGCRSKLQDRAVLRLLRSDWEASIGRVALRDRIFIPLGVHPESTIDYWVRNTELLDYEGVTVDVALTFAAQGFSVIVKDHPNMFGLRRRAFMERLAEVPGLILVPYDVPARHLVDETACTFSFGGTVGLQAAFAGRTPIVADPYYLVDDQFVRLQDRQSIAALPAQVRGFSPPADRREARRLLLAQVLRTTIPGDYLSTWKRSTDDQARREMGAIADGLNGHFETLLSLRPR
jgi:hypothetical protein